MSTVHHNDVEKAAGTHHEYGTSHSTAGPTYAANGTGGLRQIGNPGPLGLSAFALTTFVLSLINLWTRDVTAPNIVIGLALFYGGMVQFAAGMWEFAVGNTFGATALSSYGGFWLSYAVILIPGFNVAAGYNGDVEEFHTAISFYLFGWFIFTFLMFIAVLRHSVAFIFLFFTLDLAFLMLAISEYVSSTALQKAGGVFGLLAAFTAWYCAISQLLTKDNSYFTLPLVSLQKKAI
ncbi:hypothetical protein M408DRAFT_308141 [Serendipita vermifera MAFF 305830]|uniref:Uncharacterized protein n=1 Tax=Serendipita vermifera MAFF 305830 TaxID=933852 RepID=A0A0C2WS47_SERVB|nr:hypothetical protein M408DRAFT_308141 [Serendipita vermifera MAFF 305830]